jgi:hypothetical protein
MVQRGRFAEADDISLRGNPEFEAILAEVDGWP